MKSTSFLVGRQWLSSQEDFNTIKNVTKIKAIENKHCNRCGSLVSAKLPNGKKYCRGCIEIGRIVEGDYLIRYDQEFTFPKRKNGALTWTGKLTDDQAKLSYKLVDNFENEKNTLVYAVTGAGKTEMLFPVIAKCIAKGKRCGIATPRIDVVNELYPRFQAAFSTLKIGKYHGRDYKEPQLEQLTICTTHQLLKFYHAFDLLIIDEADSFPYANDSRLHFGAVNAAKTKGVRVYLTATPPPDLLQEVKRKKLTILRLNHRFHGGLLHVPKEKLFLRPFIKKGQLHSKLLKEIIDVISKGHPLLLFVPRVEQVAQYLNTLQKEPQLKIIKMDGVHAEDKERLDKVQKFRDGELQLLVTTTILERGVTFKHVWVIVVAADDQIYTTSSLVQIAGRVGRAKDDPDGLVLFCYHKYTESLRSAVKQIAGLNQ